MEMAAGSQVRFVLRFRALPLYPGRWRCTRPVSAPGSNAGNRALCGGRLRFDAPLTPERQEVLFDPQTSGGLLVALPEAQAREYVRDLHAAGMSWAR